MSTAVLPLEVWEEGITQPRFAANDNALRVEAIERGALTFAASAPGSPADGNVHIVSTAWGGFSVGDIVLYRGGQWYGFAPVMGLRKYMDADSKLYVYDGGWNEVAGGGGSTIPQNSQSAAYTLVLTDAGKHILHPSADTTARTFTIPANSSVAFPIGAAVTFVNQNGAGVVTIAITSDTMRLAGAGTTGSRSLAANGVATALKITATEWIISGAGLS